MSIRDHHELTTTSGVAVPAYSTMNKVGFTLAIIMGLSNVVSIASPTPDGEVGPPLAILVVDAVLGVGIVASVLIGWLRQRKAAIRAATAMLILTAVTALPAFVASGVPAAVVAVAGIFVLLTIVTVVLMLKPARSDAV